VQHVFVYAEEYKQERKKRRTGLLALGLVAAVVLSVAVWAIWRMPPKQEIVDKSKDVPNRPLAEPVAADAGNRQNSQPAIPRFEKVTIELPSRWRGAVGTEPPIVLPRGRLQLEVRLPIGSSEGKYTLRILDNSGRVCEAMASTARTVDGITRLKIALDTSNVSPGDYKLSVLEPGLDEWTDYPLTVK
jgi:hypothetical protein